MYNEFSTLHSWNHRRQLHVVVVMCGLWHVQITQQEVGCVADGGSHESIHHPHHLSSVTILTFTTSYLSPHSQNLLSQTQSSSATGLLSCVQRCISESNPQSHVTYNRLSSFSTVAVKKTSTTTEEHSDDICGWTGRSASFVYMWTIYRRHHSLLRFSKRKDAGALKRTKGEAPAPTS